MHYELIDGKRTVEGLEEVKGDGLPFATQSN